MIETVDLEGRLRWSSFMRLSMLLALAVLAISVAGWVVQQGGQAVEQARIAEVLEIEPGMVVADIGAGEGDWSIDLARRVGPSGRVYSTEVEPRLLDAVRRAAADAGLDNVSVVEGGASSTNLPERCCDAILLRRVYHHFTDPAGMTRSMLRSLKPGGLLAVVDFEPGSRGLQRPEGVPEDRGGHGVPTDLLRREMTAAGFETVRRVEGWPGGQRDFCLLFRRPDGG